MIDLNEYKNRVLDVVKAPIAPAIGIGLAYRHFIDNPRKKKEKEQRRQTALQSALNAAPPAPQMTARQSLEAAGITAGPTPQQEAALRFALTGIGDRAIGSGSAVDRAVGLTQGEVQSYLRGLQSSVQAGAQAGAGYRDAARDIAASNATMASTISNASGQDVVGVGPVRGDASAAVDAANRFVDIASDAASAERRTVADDLRWLAGNVAELGGSRKGDIALAQMSAQDAAVQRFLDDQASNERVINNAIMEQELSKFYSQGSKPTERDTRFEFISMAGTLDKKAFEQRFFEMLRTDPDLVLAVTGGETNPDKVRKQFGG